MKAKPYKKNAEGNGYVECSPAEADHVMIHMLGPFPNRFLPVILKGSRDSHSGPIWTWNSDTEKPTLKPSVLTKGSRMITDDEADRISKGETLNLPDEVCHTWINDGKAQYLGDCTHEFAGKTLDLLEVD